ncbi:uncharacterized protein LOC128862248 [Anastrepha ludens]|uniref:uncharacterized protein LOC128862248 n=1 Tax=Anastrepha ludens TaxID=28586 RepID=UPI0023B12A10|nr:uncharacterized protein LOC128862248 [Anastrepha ludens]XP_053956746.1 uncharacterized protein LOC128862248 [Anastrepha ludens]XP_053956747.1 uncharacterized protein LOC128862248 [Anastrepha ludens]XP_053956748.1 uncharacterized protein LOC128862248 [Anastrepha ludens]XP_053956749.1 uncharacterized protein LOC128862248 [Anastrepha ludens]
MASTTTEDPDIKVTLEDLPITFRVKYVGCEVARGIWGIKYTRRPVDIMVSAAKRKTPKQPLTQCNLKVSTEGITVDIIGSQSNINNWSYPIDTISYGVQDIVFNRVFAMIVVKDEEHPNPFEVHAFVCDSRATARKLTYALAAAFQEYSRVVGATGKTSQTDSITPTRQRFAIDLRSPEQQAGDEEEETEA